MSSQGAWKRILRAVFKLLQLVLLTFRSLRQDGLKSTTLKIIGVLQSSLKASGALNEADAAERPPAKKASKVFNACRVTIIADLGIPQCTMYRVSQKVQILRSIGVTSHVADHNDFFRAKTFLQISTAVIFYRTTLENKATRLLLDEARRCGLTVLYDIDDPIFCERTYRSNTNIDALSSAERGALLRSSDGFLRAMKKADVCTASTPELTRLMSEASGRPAYLWRNLVSQDSIGFSTGQTGQRNSSNSRPLTIFYGSGSRAHERDFEIMGEAVRQFLAEFPDARFKVCGYIDESRLKGLSAEQVDRLQFSDYGTYLRALAESDVSLVPLEASEFNSCKSAVRYLDALLVGTRTIASAVGDYVNLTSYNLGLTLCDSEDQWLQELRLLQERTKADSCQQRSDLISGCLKNFSANAATKDSSPHIDPHVLQLLTVGHP